MWPCNGFSFTNSLGNNGENLKNVQIILERNVLCEYVLVKLGIKPFLQTCVGARP